MTEIRDITDLFYLFPNTPMKGGDNNDESKTIHDPCVYHNA